jgi:hypothetical protein
MSITLEQARNAKQKVLQIVEENPLLRDSLAGVGITFANVGYGVKVNLSKPLADESLLPESIDGVPLQVEIAGKIEKFD